MAAVSAVASSVAVMEASLSVHVLKSTFYFAGQLGRGGGWRGNRGGGDIGYRGSRGARRSDYRGRNGALHASTYNESTANGDNTSTGVLEVVQLEKAVKEEHVEESQTTGAWACLTWTSWTLSLQLASSRSLYWAVVEAVVFVVALVCGVRVVSAVVVEILNADAAAATGVVVIRAAST